ncbi:MAG: hypothetical protein JWL66_2035 [Sphingomonadales bacterium]|nr:hypothetical protein [Sphingomonadales bacterium]
MQLIVIFLQAMGDVAGGMVVALVTGLAFWNLFKLIHRPEWGPVVSFAIVTVILVSTHRVYRMVPMITLFGLMGIICSWSEGAAWRARRNGQNRIKDVPRHLQGLRTHYRNHPNP